jgi:hypothetical protein
MTTRPTSFSRMQAFSSILTLLGGVLLASCEAPPPSQIETEENPIYHGTDFSTNPITGVVRTCAPPHHDWSCSGMVYNKYWVITAAHCFHSSSDLNGDGVITPAEAYADDPYAPFEVQRAMSAAGTLTNIAIQAAFRQPPGLYWGDSAVPDVALVRLNTTGAGVYIPNLYSGFYANQQLRLYQGSVRSWNPLESHYAIAYGYGPIDSSGTGRGLLHAAWKKIAPYPESYLYGGIKYNDAGPGCPGDSGGPDMYQVGTDDYQDLGIHHTGDDLNCVGSQDMNMSVEEWRDWIYAMARPNREATKWRDVDFDGKDDLVFFRATSGVWQVNVSSGSGGTYFSRTYGQSGDVPVPGDYDGDARTDNAVWRPSNGTWHVLPSDGSAERVTQWGISIDVPAPGDYDGDGKTDLVVFRPRDGVWFVVPSGGGAAYQWSFGQSGDQPVPGDYDGDGKTDLAYYRSSNGTWYYHPSSGGADQSSLFGLPTDTPIPGDYDGDGKTDYAVYRRSNSSWYIRPSAGGGDQGFFFGPAGQVLQAVPRDYDGDRKADPAYTRYQYVSGLGNRVTLTVKQSTNGQVVTTTMPSFISSQDLTP